MLYGIALVVVLTFLIWEARKLSRARDAITVRVHVHGTRGKTSTVQQTAKLLRDAGLRVLAKTTGDNPEYILPDGTIQPIRRIGPARITEHVKAILLAEKLGVDALVVEGMALQRENIAFSERILCATHAAVVNVRPDHGETMGEGYDGVAETLSLMIPKQGRFFVTSEHTELLQKRARAAGIVLVVVDAPAMEHAQYLAQTLSSVILEERSRPVLEVPITSSNPTAPFEFELEGFPVAFVDCFSANDVVSTGLLCDRIDGLHDERAMRIAFFASRSDRPMRTLSFVRMLSGDRRFDRIAFGGNHRWFALFHIRFFSPSVFPRVDMVSQKTRETLTTWVKMAQEAGKTRLLVVGMGNTHGAGEAWRAALVEMKGTDNAH